MQLNLDRKGHRLRERRALPAGEVGAAPSPASTPALRGGAWLLLAAVLALALGLRLHGLDERVLGHPENFVPGLDMPDWVRFPPERKDLLSILRGTLIDGHPPGYFVAMLGWVELAGTSLAALRLPSALAGALSVGLVFALARRITSARGALVAALLLALHGFHVYWSQFARMYVPTACVGLLSTWLLVRAHGSRRRAHEIAYVGVTASALWMQLYAWPLLLGQIVWVVWDALRRGRPARLLTAQGLALLLGLPVVQLALYQNPPSRWLESPIGWWRMGYLLYERVPLASEPHPLFEHLGTLSLVCGVLVLLFALARPGREIESAAEAPAGPLLGRWAITGLALAVAAAMALFPLVVTWGSAAPRWVLWACVGLPLIGAAMLEPTKRGVDALAASGAFARLPRLGIAPCLAVLPIAVMILLSTVRPCFVARGTVVFVPYFVLCAGLATEALWEQRRSLGVAALAILVGLHASSIVHFRDALGSPRDYRELAERMTAELAPDDLILVHDNFVYPPLFYYLRAEQQLVHTDHAAAVNGSGGRVWLVRFGDNPPPSDILAAVAERDLVGSIEVRGGAAELYARRP